MQEFQKTQLKQLKISLLSNYPKFRKSYISQLRNLIIIEIVRKKTTMDDMLVVGVFVCAIFTIMTGGTALSLEDFIPLLK